MSSGLQYHVDLQVDTNVLKKHTLSISDLKMEKYSPKHCYLPPCLHGITMQKTNIDIFTTENLSSHCESVPAYNLKQEIIAQV
jgi:hypothetical protein